ncbi:MAG: hypothetical protein EBZ67_04790 [Chitinophagia bacterium]|nr:hypothetical protein [Chitinophagia bacterium]
MKRYTLLAWILILQQVAGGQTSISTYDPLFADIALQSERDKLQLHLRDRTIGETLSLPLDAENEYRYQSAFWAVSQFKPDDPRIAELFRRSLGAYRRLETETRRSFLEALYTMNPDGYADGLTELAKIEENPKLFAMMALFLHRRDPSLAAPLLEIMRRRWPLADEHPILSSLSDELLRKPMRRTMPTPDLRDLFRHQQSFGIKTVYSFQRWDRDQPGLAAIQGADGLFARDSSGRIILIRQLARAGSNLPYYITNGNTPQGVFSIQGIGRSVNRFIGPTPNLQMTLPFEDRWKGYFLMPADSTEPRLSYAYLLPDSWRDYPPIWEAYEAGRAGRTEIIAHGTTIDPQYFRGQPYHPISPTLGCLCAPEEWDTQTGSLRQSEQLRLAETFLKAAGPSKGYLMVINMDDQRRPLSRDDIEPILEAFEKDL